MVPDPKVVKPIFKSRILEGNRKRDPAERFVPIYLPPGYDVSRKEPYPMVFLLSGWGSRGERFLNDEGVFSYSLPQLFDHAIARNELDPVIVVMPDCGTRLGSSQYVNSEGNGAYMDYICDELVPFVEGNFHAGGNRELRGVAGHSSGGFGALAIGMVRPDVFSTLCSAAGDTWYELLYWPLIPKAIKILKSNGGAVNFIENFLRRDNPLSNSSRDEGLTMMLLCICSCYAPNPLVETVHGDLFFDLDSGAIHRDVWERILAWDPIHMAKNYVPSLKSLRWIHLDAGKEDEFALHLGHRQLSNELRRLGIDHSLTEFEGRHGGNHHRFVMRIQRMIEAMKR